MRVGSRGMNFCFALKLWGGDVGGISSVFRKARRTVELKSFARMVTCLCEEMELQEADPTICLNKRISQFFGESRFGRDFVAHRLDVIPPVLVWTFHGPTAQFTDDDYADALADIVKAFHEMAGRNTQSYVCIGGVDFKCQLGFCRGVTGRYSKGERPGEAERARELYGFLAKQGLRVVNTFLMLASLAFPHLTSWVMPPTKLMVLLCRKSLLIVLSERALCLFNRRPIMCLLVFKSCEACHWPQVAQRRLFKRPNCTKINM